MNQSKIIDFLDRDITHLNGVGIKIKKLLKKKKVEKISDLLWSFPQGYTDRTNIKTLNNLEIGKITTIKVKVLKYNFPRIRNLPSKVTCEDNYGKIDIVFFNSNAAKPATTNQPYKKNSSNKFNCNYKWKNKLF